MEIALVIGIVILAIIVVGALLSGPGRADRSLGPREQLRRHDPLNPDHELDQLRMREHMNLREQQRYENDPGWW